MPHLCEPLKESESLKTGGYLTQTSLNLTQTSPPFTHMKAIWNTRVIQLAGGRM
jgi:hypothetical protein